MTCLKKLALLCALALVPSLAFAQTAVSGSKVVDNNGNLLASGQWCFGASCLTVTNGAFSGSVTAGTQTVTVTNGSGTTYLTVPSVTVGASAFLWDSYVVPTNVTASGMGAPRIACQVGAAFTRTDASSPLNSYACVSVAGQAVWALSGSPAGANPSGFYAGTGAPNFTCTVPCAWFRTDTNVVYGLAGAVGTQGNTWTAGSITDANAVHNNTTSAQTVAGPLFVDAPLMAGSYLAFGDSITHGNGGSSYSNGYPYWIAKASGYALTDLGVPGSTSQTNDPVIFANTLPVGSKQLISYMIGTNNVGNDPSYPTSGTAALEQDYELNIEAQYAWLGIPAANRLLFGSGSVSYTGSWSNSTLLGSSDPGKSCGGTACAATFSVTGPTIYLVTAMQNGNTAAAATLTCDGVATGATLYFAGINGTTIPTASGQTSLTRVTGLSNTTHSCTVQSTSSTGTVYLEWAAGMNGALPANAPTVLAGGIPDRNPTDAVTPGYRAYQPTVVTTLRGDGLTNITYVATTGVLGSLNYADGTLHPNDYGHYLLASPFVSALGTALGTSFSEPPFTTQVVSNTAQYGTQNFGIGPYALSSTSLTGIENFAAGFDDLVADTSGNYNTAVGDSSMTLNTTGSWNTAVGLFALDDNISGNYNTAVGQGALGASTANSNTAAGHAALQSTTTGGSNTAVGDNAGTANTTGQQNVVAGANAMEADVSGSYNTVLGWSGLSSAAASSENVAIGWAALQNATVGQQTAVGRSALQEDVTGVDNTALGYEVLANSTASYNTGAGYQALTTNTTGAYSAAFGVYSLEDQTTGQGNSALGSQSLQSITTGSDNVGVGQTAGSGLATTSNSVFVGQAATASSDGLTNVIAIGQGATAAASNTAVVGNANVTDVYDGSTSASAVHHSAGYMGPATAPSGSCSKSGEWVFSQDGHATFCSAGTWVTKI